jgi:hypothetical protein
MPVDVSRPQELNQRRRCRHLLKASLRENALLIMGTAIYVAVCYALKFHLALSVSPHDDILFTYLGTLGFFAVAAFCVFALWFLYLTRIKRQPKVLDYVGARLKQIVTADRFFLMLPVLLIWPWFVNSFSYLKVLIPYLKPFYLDPYLMRWDRVLHFGRQPFEWLSPILDHALPLLILNWTYAFWFLVFITILLLQMANTTRRRLRLRYLMAQMIAWPLFGNFFATILSSAGPAYYGLLFSGENPYAAHLLHLRELAQQWQVSLFGIHLQLPFTAVMMQQMLWDAYQRADFLGMGISACPSLHVASSWLIARLCQEYGRRAAICGYTFVLLIFLASVQMGWHYAIDGYLGALGGWLCWRLTGFILSRPLVIRMLNLQPATHEIGVAA